MSYAYRHRLAHSWSVEKLLHAGVDLDAMPASWDAGDDEVARALRGARVSGQLARPASEPCPACHDAGWFYDARADLRRPCRCGLRLKSVEAPPPVATPRDRLVPAMPEEERSW